MSVSAWADAFLDGNRALSEGRAKEALEHYGRSRADHAFLHYNRGFALQQLGRHEEALQSYRKALETAPWSTYRLVRVLPSGSRPLSILETEPTDLLRSRTLTRLGELSPPEQALEYFQQARELAAPEDLSAILGLARALASQQRAGAAAHYYQEFLEAAVVQTGSPMDQMVWGPGTLSVGERRLKDLRLRVTREGRVQTAEGLDLGIGLPPQSYGLVVETSGRLRVHNARTGLSVAVGQLRVGPDSRLLGGLRWAHPDADRAWHELAEVSPELEEQVRHSPFQSADERLAELESLAANSYRALRLGNLYLAQALARNRVELLQKSEEPFLRWLKAEPDLDLGYYNLAALRFLQGRPQDAFTLLEQLPRRRQSYRYRIEALARQQRWPELLKVVDDFRQAFPQDPMPRLIAAEVYLGTDRLEQAEELIESCQGVEADYLKVRLLARQGKFRAQVALLEQLLKTDLTPYRAQRLLAELIERLGQAERAQQLREAYLDSGFGLYFEPNEYSLTRASYELRKQSPEL